MSYIRRLSIFLYLLRFKIFNKNKVILSIRANIDFKTAFGGNNKINKNVSILGTYVGSGTYIGRNATLNHGKVGNFCSIAPFVECVGGAHPLAPYASTHPAFFSLKKQAGFTFVSSQKFEESRLTREFMSFSIGNDVWIGYGVRMMEGISIGDGSVVASGSVVTKDIPSYEIWGGVPAKKLKDRFPEETKIKLSDMQWWNREFSDLKKQVELFQNVDKLVESLGKGT